MPSPTSPAPVHPHPTPIPVPVIAVATIPTPTVRAGLPIPTPNPRELDHPAAPVDRVLPARGAVLQGLTPVQVPLTLVPAQILAPTPVRAVILAQLIQEPPTIVVAVAMIHLRKAVIRT